MSDTTTIARPYAKAVFEHARDTKALALWSLFLHDLANAVLDPNAMHFIGNPAATVEAKTSLLLSIFAASDPLNDRQTLASFVALLALNGRLAVLPDIYVQFEALRASEEKRLTVSVASFIPLTSTEQQQLIEALSRRLARHVTLDMSIDPSLLGGAVVRAGDLVIDGSVRGKLTKLGASLAA